MRSSEELTDLLYAALSELRYIYETGDVRDSERNAREMCDDIAQVLNCRDYEEFCAKETERERA